MFEDFLNSKCEIYTKSIANTGGISKTEEVKIFDSSCRIGSANTKDLRIIAHIKDVSVNVSKIYLPAGIALEDHHVIKSGSYKWKIIYIYPVCGMIDIHHIKALISKIV